MSVFFSLLGHLWALAKCHQLLTEVKKTRSTLDTSGICVSGYEQQVEVRANAKYDLCQREVLSRFGVYLGDALQGRYASILKVCNGLSHHSIDGQRR